ncbi:MAG: PQQ-binding-like beta-propeller repeat protein [Nocardioidaceae bacterium]
MKRWNGGAAWCGVSLRAVAVTAGVILVAALDAGTSAAQTHTPAPHTSGERWVANYDGPQSGWGPSQDEGHDIVLAPDGQRVYVSGSSYASAPGTLSPDFATVAYDATSGERLWAARYDGPAGGADDQADLGMSPDGSTIFVTGLSTGKGTGNDFATIAYDAATGQRLWLARYDGPVSGSDWATALAVSPEGSTLFVTGYSHSRKGPDYGIVAYDADTGEQRWVTHFDGPGHGTDAPKAIDVSPDGSTVVVTGQGSGVDTGLCDWGTVAFDADTGQVLWDALYDGPASGIDVGDALTTTSAGTVVVTGSISVADTGPDWATVAYSLDSGEKLWEESYDGDGGTDVPRAVTLAPDGGSVVVTGNSWGKGTESDYATISYDAATGE